MATYALPAGTMCAESSGLREACVYASGHPGEHSWEEQAAQRAAWEARTHCSEGATGDPFCDVECQRERGHDGPHRYEWEA